MKPCKQCGAQILDDAYTCPMCGAEQTESQPIESKRKSGKPFIIIGIILGVIAIVFAGMVIRERQERENMYIGMIRDHTPYTGRKALASYTCGEVFDRYILDAEWEVKLGDTTNYLTVSGTAKGKNTNLGKTISDLAITMILEDLKDGTFSFNLDEIEINRMVWTPGGEQKVLTDVLTGKDEEIAFLSLFIAYHKEYNDLSDFDDLLYAVSFMEEGVSLPETFTDETHGFSFPYPSGWEITENPTADFDSEITRIAEITTPKYLREHTAKFAVSLIDKVPYHMNTGNEEKVEKAINQINGKLISY